jgi:hypothetical protein
MTITITTPPKYFSQRSGIKAKFGRELYNNPTGRFLEIFLVTPPLPHLTRSLKLQLKFFKVIVGV